MNTMDLFELMMAFSGGISRENNSNELERRDNMLTEAGIPFESFGMQICYYGPNGRPKPNDSSIWEGPGVGAICSVIANGYGFSEGFLEISGLMTQEEMDRTDDTVLNGLNAEGVFERIRAHYMFCK